jgi:hypothetical protein
MIFIDTFEPIEIFDLLKQTAEVERVSLNFGGMADYMWQAVDGHFIQVERKQWGEILSDIDAIEAQLRREITQVEETYLLIEGVADPTPWGVDAYVKSTDKPYYRCAHTYGDPKRPRVGEYSKIQSWLWQLDKAGISIIQTPNLAGTAICLSAVYRNSLKAEHTTLRRYIKPKISPKPFNPHVLTLMGVAGAELGETRAKALIERFETAWNVLCAPVEKLCEVDGIGPKTAERIAKAIGRQVY